MKAKIRHRNRIRKFWQRTRDPEVKSEFRTLSREGALGSVANHPLEKAEVIADSLQKQFEPNTEAENDRFTARTQRKIKRFLDAPTCLDLEKTTPGKVRVENSLSTPRPILSGVPQGSLLGPKLFNLYINDIPKAVGVHLAMYADDTAIFTQNIYNYNIIEWLQNYVIRLETSLNDWKIKVNASKSACLLFTRQRCIGNLPHDNIFNQPVPWVTEYKYPGLILDTKLNFAKHIRSAHQKAAGMRCTLNRLISPKSKLALRQKVLLYKAILRPIMLYASPIWAAAEITHLKRLHTFQNIQLRRAANAPWFVRNEVLHKDLNVLPLLNSSKNNQKIS
ncbi:RNA-directed DNA polymerase from mobile element jockey [Trichonephila clavipes]|nr:RNA-directed DNA polymerase from mobile element jockey [Trichonephila clavipes]